MQQQYIIHLYIHWRNQQECNHCLLALAKPLLCISNLGSISFARLSAAFALTVLLAKLGAIFAGKHNVISVLGALDRCQDKFGEIELSCAELILEPCKLWQQSRAVGAIRVKVTVANAAETWLLFAVVIAAGCLDVTVMSNLSTCAIDASASGRHSSVSWVICCSRVCWVCRLNWSCVETLSDGDFENVHCIVQELSLLNPSVDVCL